VSLDVMLRSLVARALVAALAIGGCGSVSGTADGPRRGGDAAAPGDGGTAEETPPADLDSSPGPTGGDGAAPDVGAINQDAGPGAARWDSPESLWDDARWN
jgi:hypothetical protein